MFPLRLVSTAASLVIAANAFVAESKHVFPQPPIASEAGRFLVYHWAYEP